MTEEKKRRGRGEGGVRWDERRQRYIAETTVDYNANGKRIVRSGSGKSETEALRNMRAAVDKYRKGLVPEARHYTVRKAVENWLQYGQGSRAGEKTREKNRIICETHIIPFIGGQKLQRLTVQHLDEWLAGRAEVLATDSLRQVRRLLRQSIRRAMIHGMVDRNVADLVDLPRGRAGRPSKSLTLAQAKAILTATEGDTMHPYIVVSLLTGARTEEVRALRWDHVNLDGDPDADPPMPPHMFVWRSDREGGETKTRKSKRTLALPKQVAVVLGEHRVRQAQWKRLAKESWVENDHVFTTTIGSALDAANVRRSFRRALGKVEGIEPKEWTPRELRHSFVSLLSEYGVSVEEIARLVGHTGGSKVTELIYRHELRPVMETGAQAMDAVFGKPGKEDRPEAS
ncbi:tyrosine-type recombinase/integrase [Nocardioides sp. NPDC047086]|uniref:site-specific integrase n=1 Tax=Nocardioides sp. NPDC047086 TaxID=3154810 RepID=UPI0033F8CAC9